MTGDRTKLREFVGFVWPDDDFSNQTGLLVMSLDVTEAVARARDAYGDGFRVSLWNEEDAAKRR